MSTNTDDTDLLLGPQEEYDDEAPNDTKEINGITAFGLTINTVIGTGFFSLPYTFYEAGLPLSILLIILCGSFCILADIWIIELTARARGYQLAKEKNLPYTSSLNKFTYKMRGFPEMGSIFSGKTGFWVCQCLISIISLGVLWNYNFMFASTAANLYQHYVSKDHCEIDQSPDRSCWMAYEACLLGYFIVTLILQVFNMGHLALIQQFFTIYRFSAFILIFVSCLISLFCNGAYWGEDSDSFPDQTKWQGVYWDAFTDIFSASCFAIDISFSVPIILQPLTKPKRHAPTVIISASVLSLFIFIFLSVLLAFTLGPHIRPYIILCFEYFGKRGFEYPPDDGFPDENWYSIMLKAVIMCFPLFNLISATPIVISSWAYSFTDSLPFHFAQSHPFATALVIKFLLAFPPYVLAASLPSMTIIIDFAGLAVSFVAFFIPAFFQWYSKRVTGNEWRTPYSGWWSSNFFIFLVLLFSITAFVFSVYVFVTTYF